MLKLDFTSDYPLEDDFDFDIEIIEDVSYRAQTCYNRQVDCDAVSMSDLLNREEDYVS
jgi:hypothetical protein